MITKTKRKIERVQKQLNSYDMENPSVVYNYHGGWSVGYLMGKLSVLEDLLDDLNEPTTMKKPDFSVKAPDFEVTTESFSPMIADKGGRSESPQTEKPPMVPPSQRQVVEIPPEMQNESF